MAGAAANTTAPEIEFETTGGLANFWGHRTGKLRLTSDCLSLKSFRTNEIIGSVPLSEIQSIQPILYWSFWDYFLGLCLPSPILLRPLFFRYYFTIQMTDGTRQRLIANKRNVWIQKISDVISLNTSRNPGVIGSTSSNLVVKEASIDLPQSLEQAKKLLDTLEQLGRLKEKGILTKEGFDAKKRHLLRAA